MYLSGSLMLPRKNYERIYAASLFALYDVSVVSSIICPSTHVQFENHVRTGLKPLKKKSGRYCLVCVTKEMN